MVETRNLAASNAATISSRTAKAAGTTWKMPEATARTGAIKIVKTGSSTVVKCGTTATTVPIKSGTTPEIFMTIASTTAGGVTPVGAMAQLIHIR